jgi:hypothetical protein
MASFALVLASPDLLSMWVYDGVRLASHVLGKGTHMVTSGGAEDGKADRYLGRFETEDWSSVLHGERPEDDLAALVVRHSDGERVFATVFGQLMDSAPGRLSLSWSRTPWLPDGWTSRSW